MLRCSGPTIRKNGCLGEILTTLPRSRDNWRFAAMADNPDSLVKSDRESVTRPKARCCAQTRCLGRVDLSSWELEVKPAS